MEREEVEKKTRGWVPCFRERVSRMFEILSDSNIISQIKCTIIHNYKCNFYENNKSTKNILNTCFLSSYFTLQEDFLS